MTNHELPLKPGVYFDLCEDVYHDDPAERPSLSSSIGKILLSNSPLHAWTAHPRLNREFETSNERKFDLGKAVHAICLEDKPERIAIIPHTDYRTSAAKAARDKYAAEIESARSCLPDRHADILAAIAEKAHEFYSPDYGDGGKDGAIPRLADQVEAE